MDESLKGIKNEKSEPEKTYEQRIVNLMREIDNCVKLYAELSTSDSKFRRTIIILEKVFLCQRDARIFELEERIRERESRDLSPMRYSAGAARKGEKGRRR